ncbi:glycosyltransferase family 8 protein [Patellaria atrata CBS 101060]|uniref:Glycosyltransferase family 8 protein n=1 Tax=Patellaria atrata CBS 101060 TaxID=1346257 RepID=A0A9P4SJK6_9PEZI|nr:glycosyltransferase family 8 protein [Patellaria atrata CBS 101060]
MRRVQLAPETKCKRDIPFVVLVTNKVSECKRLRLEADGARVVEVQDVPLSWWIRTRLRLLQMVEYELVLFIDADTLIVKPVDGIFEELDVGAPQRTLFERSREVKRDEEKLPASYVFAAHSDNAFMGEREHQVPPGKTPIFSAGFWVAAPSEELFKSFDPHTIEQSLLNYAFRREDATPWIELDWRWSATWPSKKDLMGGVATLHEKFWKTGPEELMKLYDKRKDMEEFFRRGRQDPRHEWVIHLASG